MKDAARVGAWKNSPNPGGEDHPGSKLTAAQVVEIRSLRGSMKRRDMARKYGVSKATIDAILANRTWRHLLRRFSPGA